MHVNNPAARLHQVLALCKKHERESGTRPMLTGWRRVFRMADGVKDFAVMERIGQVYTLAGEVSDWIDRFEDLDSQLYLGWCEELEEAFVNLSFRSEFATFTKRVPRTLLVNVEFCSNALAERCREPVVDPGELSELNTITGDLIRKVQSADLDEAGKRYFLDYLTIIRRALNDYPLAGAPGLQRAIDACTGTLATQRQVSIPTRETPAGKGFWSLTNRIARALSPPEELDEEEGGRGGQRPAFRAVLRKAVA